MKSSFCRRRLSIERVPGWHSGQHGTQRPLPDRGCQAWPFLICVAQMKNRLLCNCCIAFWAAFLTGCGSHLSGVYEADYSELISQEAKSSSQMLDALSPILGSLPADARRRMEQQQQQAAEQFSSVMARSIPPLRLDFSWWKVTSSYWSVETTCSYTAGRDYVLISFKHDGSALRLQRRSDGTLACNGLVFRQIPGSGSSGPFALFVWIGVGLLLASSAAGALWYLKRHGILGAVVLFFDEHFVLPRAREHETQSCKVLPLPPLASQDDSRFRPPGAGKPDNERRFMPPEMLSAPAPSTPPATSRPKP